MTTFCILKVEIKDGEIPALVISNRKWKQGPRGAKLVLKIPEVNQNTHDSLHCASNNFRDLFLGRHSA